MTILQALVQHYKRLEVAGKMPIRGFGPAQISFTIVLDAKGRYVTTEDERVGNGKKLRPRAIMAPLAPQRSSDIVSCSFWDKTSYVFGRTTIDETVSAARQVKDAERLAKEHAAFLARHESLVMGSSDAGLVALLRFLRSWSPDEYGSLVYAEDMLDQNVVFRLEGSDGHIHDRPAARAVLEADSSTPDDILPSAMCLVTGDVTPIARIHPQIKGVRGSQQAGARLVSFKLDASTSYGRLQGKNAPVSKTAASDYVAALNGLLEPGGWDTEDHAGYTNRVLLGDTTLVFWGEHGVVETLMLGMIGGRGRAADEEEEEEGNAPPATNATDAGKLRDVQRRMEDGIPLSQLGIDLAGDTRTYVLGLSPNAARLSVRFWVEQDFAALTRHFQEHWQDLRLEPKPRVRLPSLWRLLLELAPQRDAAEIPKHLTGEVMRAILTGEDYPQTLLVQTIMRIRADGNVNRLRVALAKSVIARRARRAAAGRLNPNPDAPPWKDRLVALDRDETNIGYRLGRLFALLDYVQYLSVGSVNAGVKEKFLASASASPARIFPTLLHMAQYHLSDARKASEKQSRATHVEEEIKQVMDGLQARAPFPTTLSLDDQGRFIVGFYHQKSRHHRWSNQPGEWS
jgi:CRISPR-associated protein Csd1